MYLPPGCSREPLGTRGSNPAICGPTLATTTRPCITCHGVKQLVGLQICEDGEAAGTAEGGAVGGVSFVRLDAAPDVVQLVLDHVDQQSGRT